MTDLTGFWAADPANEPTAEQVAEALLAGAHVSCSEATLEAATRVLAADGHELAPSPTS